jgi:DNA repair protein RadA/Sms
MKNSKKLKVYSQRNYKRNDIEKQSNHLINFKFKIMKQPSFVCSNCKRQHLKWAGVCNSCNSINTIIESKNDNQKVKRNIKVEPPMRLSEISITEQSKRLISRINEFDNVLGGGVVQKSVILIAGMPGVGKSTLLLYIADAIASYNNVLYIATEESIEQIKIRSERMTLQHHENLLFSHETKLENIFAMIEQNKPKVAIIDSLQNIAHEETFLANHIGTIRNVAQTLVEHAKSNGYALIITAHVTKDGSLAGPKSLEHIVDTVLYIDNDSESNLRILRSTKNRFGSTDEVGFFTMTDKGITQCEDPQGAMLDKYIPSIGSACTWHKEGKRAFIVEIQVLLNTSKTPNIQRIISGVEQKQFMLVCAVIERYLKIPLYKYDIFCKTAGNLKIKEPHIDVPLTLAILSSYFNRPIDIPSISCGELDLSGSVFLRSEIPLSEDFLKKYGIIQMLLPKTNNRNNNIEINNIYNLASIFKKT